LMNDILQQKAFWKLFINVTSTALVIGGVAMTRANGLLAVQLAGLGCIVVGGIGYIVGACVNPKADSRHWKNLPGEFYLLPLKLPPGKHVLHLDGYILADQVFRQSFEVEINPNVKVNVFNLRLDNSLIKKPDYLEELNSQLRQRYSASTQENLGQMNLQGPHVHYSEKTFSDAMIKQKLEK